MTDTYCLEYRSLHYPTEETTASREPAAVFRLSAGGAPSEDSELSCLRAGEGFLMYSGDFYVMPLEIEIEFLKADSARHWLEALVLRHVERVRRVEDDLWVLAGIEEVCL